MSFISIPSLAHSSPASTRPTSRQDVRILEVSYHEQYSSTIELLEPEEVPDRNAPNYKPLPLKWPFLVLLFAIILCFLGLAEAGIRAFPPGLTSRTEDIHSTFNNGSQFGDISTQPVAVIHDIAAPHPPTESYAVIPATFWPLQQTLARSAGDYYHEVTGTDISHQCLYVRLEFVWINTPTTGFGECREIYWPIPDRLVPDSFGGESGFAMFTCSPEEMEQLE